MSGSSFGPGEIDVLHTLSLGIQLFPTPDGKWTSNNGILVKTEIIDSLIKKGLASVRDGTLNVTDEGRRALSEELDLSLRRIPEWLKSAHTRRRRTNARK
jgi:hypothetical protein